MENKHYTPELSEFFEGFEFQYQNIEQAQWISDVYRLDWEVEESGIYEYLDWGNIRVKYLDQEDIESLGFKKYGEPSHYQIEIDGIKYYLIEYGFNRYEIRPSHFSIQFGSFLGTIKNKSEFKKLLKQLGIL